MYHIVIQMARSCTAATPHTEARTATKQKGGAEAFLFWRRGWDCTRHIHVPRPSGSEAVQNGCPAVLSNPLDVSTGVAVTLRSARNQALSLISIERVGLHSAHPCASPFGQRRCAKRLSCRFVEPTNIVGCIPPSARNNNAPASGASLFLAERVGFEPTNTREDVTGIPVQRLRPLGHLSDT